MSGRWKRYPAYRESGVEWLGRIPSHWQVKRLGYLVDLVTGFPFKSELFSTSDGIPLVRGDNVTEGRLRWGDKTRKWPHSTVGLAKFNLKAGDVLIGMDGSKVGKNYALVSETDLPLLLVQRVARLRPLPTLNTNLLFQYVGSELFRAWVELRKTDPAIPHISPADIRELPTPVASPGEQRAIAAFLDRETAKIDGLVAKKERLIELLQEKRTALISYAVTRGLNPNAPLRDSGIPWIGRIPAHWTVLHLKRCLRSTDYGISDSTADSGVYRVLTMGNIQNGEVDLEGVGFVEHVEPRLLLDVHDLLFNRTNSLELVGKAALYRGKRADCITFASYLVRLRPNENAQPEYLNYVLNCAGFLAVARSTALVSINQANLNPSRYGMLLIALPPVDEQAAIVRHLACRSAKLDALIAKVRTAIDRLQEYRTALISAAVTGQIDVREEARP